MKFRLFHIIFFSAHKGNAVERKLRLRKRRDGEKESEKVLKVTQN
jgi:hypothetical protein